MPSFDLQIFISVLHFFLMRGIILMSDFIIFEVFMKDITSYFSLPLESMEEKPISSTAIFDGKVLHVRLDGITLPNGERATREYCHHNGAVCVIPVTDNREIVCVRQYRYPFHEALLEIPAGKLDTPDEDPTSAAIRELREETGAVCEKLTYMGLYYPSPAILDEKIYMYMAEGLTFGETDFDEDEFLEILKIPVDELKDAVLNGRIKDGKTQAAVLRAWMSLASREN